MKSLRNKVILSGIVLLFALVATIGSTYAWFTVSNTVSVSSIELNVESSESLLLLVDDGYNLVDDEAYLEDATNYKANLTMADIIASTLYDTELATWRLVPVTAAQLADGVTNDGSDATNLDALDASAFQLMDIDSKVYSAASANQTDGGYIQIDFWALSQSTTSEDIILEDLEIASDSGNSLSQDEIVDAVNLAVYDNDSKYSIFSLDPDYEFAFATGMRGFDDDATDAISFAARTDLIELHATYYNEAGTNLANIVTNTIANATTIATLASNVPQKLSVLIYVEGWDEQTTNGVLAATFQISFKFSLKDVAS
jgi:hypothetical protein